MLCTLNLYRKYVNYFSMKLEKVRYELMLLALKTLSSINQATRCVFSDMVILSLDVNSTEVHTILFLFSYFFGFPPLILVNLPPPIPDVHGFYIYLSSVVEIFC